MNDSRFLVALSALGLCLMLAMVWQVRRAAGGGLSDFAAFYAGAKLLEEGKLYDAKRLQQLELAHAGKYSPGHGYVRPPFHAAMVWPLSLLDYAKASFVWNAVLAAALAGFVVLWRPPRWEVTLFFASFSAPAFLGFANGQDVAVLLFFVLWQLFCSGGDANSRPGRPLAFVPRSSICSFPFRFGFWGSGLGGSAAAWSREAASCC